MKPSVAGPTRLPTVGRVASIALLLILTACVPPNDQVIIPSTTKVLDSSSVSALVSVADDELRFASETPQLSSLDLGDVVAVSVSDATPYGLLRRIEAISDDGGQVVLQTSPARLQDAIDRGRFSFSRTLTEDDLVSILPPGVTLETQAAGLVFAFNDVPLNDAESIRMSGSLTIEPTLDLTIVLDLGGIEELGFGVGATQGASLEVVADDGASLDEEVPIGTPLVFTPIVVPVGPFPVVVTPVMTFVAGATGEVAANLSSSISQNAEYTLELGYQGGSFSSDETSTFGAQGDPLVVDGYASARLYTGPKLEVLIDGAAGPFAKVESYLQADASFSGSPPCLQWDLVGGLQADIGVEFLLDHETTLLDEAIELADSDGCTGITPPSSWSKTYEGGLWGAQALQRTTDGGIIMLGYDDESPPIDESAFVVKLDAAGHIAWQKTYRGLEHPSAIRQTSDGGYLLISGVPSINADRAYVGRLDADGNLLWAKAYRSNDGRGLNPRALRIHSDGSFVVVGTLEGTFDMRDVWVATFDQDGAPLWSRQYGGSLEDRANDLFIDQDGNLMIAATSTSFDDTLEVEDFWALQLNSNGDIVWQKVYGGTFRDRAATITSYGGSYLLVGDSESFDNPASPGFDDGFLLVLQLGSGGNLETATSIDAHNSSALFGESGSDVLETQDGGYAIAGASGGDLWLVKVGGSGTWSKFYGGPGRDGGGFTSGGPTIRDNLLESPEGNLVVLGASDSFAADFRQQAWLMQVTQTGAIDFDSSSDAFVSNVDGNIFSPDVQSQDTSVEAVDTPLAVTTITADVEVRTASLTVNEQAP